MCTNKITICIYVDPAKKWVVLDSPPFNVGKGKSPPPQQAFNFKRRRTIII